VLVIDAPALAQTDLLPDIIVREADLYDHVVNDLPGGQREIRLSNGTPNVGAGKLYLRGILPANPDGTQDVMQRIYRTDGTYWERLAGHFTYHSGHNHIHFDDWAQYRIRELLAGGGVGPVLAEGAKTSFCILDLQVYDSTLPGFPPGGQFLGCSGQVQGLSVGWMDIYSKSLAGQSIDITGLPDGQYWLESEVDPLSNVLESKDNNNATRIIVTIGSGGGIDPDVYESNDSTGQVDGRPVGQVNSPNLGPCNPSMVIQNLNVHAASNDDYFKFYSNHTGTSADYVRIDFTHAAGDLDLKLLNSSGGTVATSQGTTNGEQISLNGRAEGWYYVRVYGFNGATNPNYTLTINPPSNGAPSISVVNPPAGDIELLHGVDAYTTTWTWSDPENDETWVSIYMNTTPTLDGNEFLLPDALNLPGAGGFAVINSANFDPGTYWIYAHITDGGTTTGDWSSGTVTWLEEIPPCPGDADGDRVVGNADLQAVLDAWASDQADPNYNPDADFTLDGTIDNADLQVVLDNWAVICP
jgi:hypothetical protein